MNKTYVIKVNSATATVQNVQVTSGQTQPTTVKVDGNVNVELVDTATGKAPHKISVRRVGKDLHVAFEGGDPAHSDLILQDFYGENDNHLVGLAENGQYFEYIPTSGEGGFYVPLLSYGADAIQALGGAELAGAAWAPMYASAFPIGAVLGAIGAIGLAGVAIAAGGGSHKVEPLTTPTQRPNSYLDNVGPVQNLNSTATLTDDTTPGLHIGALPAGATGAVLYVDGVIKPATYDPATGTLTPNSPLPDGVHTLGYGLTNSVGTTTSSPTLTLTIDSTAPPAPVLHVADTDGDGKPNLTGTGEPGGLVTITDPAGGKYTTMVDPTGKFELEIDMPSKPLGEWIATVTDPADNVSLPGKTIVTDLTAPTAPVAGVYDNVGSIQGLVPNKGVTDDATPNVSGTAEPGSVVTVMNDGKPVGTALADGSGVWSFTLPPLVDGTYTVTTKATDSQGNTGPTSAPVVFTVDTLAPPATTASTLTDDVGRIQGPIVNGTITDDANPTFTGKAEAGATITVRDGGIVQGTALVDASGNWTYPSTTLAPGAHSFTATVTDPAGNVSPATTPINFTVDLTVPTIAVNQVNDDVGAILGALKAGDVTDDNKPTVSGTGTPGGVVKLYLDGTTTVIGTAVVDSTGQWAITPIAPLTDGKHDLTVTVTTVATGENPPSAPFPDHGFTDDATPTFTGKAEAGTTVTVMDGLANLGTTLVNPAGNWSFTPKKPLDPGVHVFTAIVSDLAGNVSAPTTPIHFTLDTSLVVIAIDQVLDDVSPIAGVLAMNASTNDTMPTVSGTATAGGLVKLYVDGTASVIGTATADSTGHWVITPTAPLVEGLHNLTATVTTATASESAATAAFTLTVDTTRPIAPVIVSSTDDVGLHKGLIANGGPSDDSTPTLRGTAEPLSTVVLYDGAVKIGTTTTDAAGNWVFTPASPFNDGTHPITATATDAAGNVSLPSATWNELVDTTLPVTPVIVTVNDNAGIYTGDLTTGTPSDDNTPTLTGTAEALSTVTIKDNGTPIATVLANAAGIWTFTPTTATKLLDGMHPLTVTSTDAAGNESQPASFLSVIDTSPPPTPFIDFSNDNVALYTGDLPSNTPTNDTTPRMSGRAEPLSKVELFDNLTIVGSTMADAAGNWTITPTLTAQGAHPITVTATDAAGNISVHSAIWVELIDTVKPNPPVIVSSGDDVNFYVGNIPSGVPTNDATPLIKGTSEANALINLFDNGVLTGTTLANALGDWSYTPTLGSQGSHAMTATATDAAGNTSPPSVIWTVNLDTIAPLAGSFGVGASNDNFGIYQGNIAAGVPTNDDTPLMSGTAEAGSLINLYDAGVLKGTATADALGNWNIEPTLTSTLLGQGVHAITITSTDVAGNVSGISPGWNIQLDTIAPTFTSAPNTAVNENTGAGTVIYAAASSDASNVAYSITGGADAGWFSINSVTGQVTMNFTPDYEAPGDSGGNNVYDYIVTATDAAGNASSQNASFSVLDVYEYVNLINNGSLSNGASGWSVNDNDGIPNLRNDSDSTRSGGYFQESNFTGSVAITGTSGGLGNNIAMRDEVAFNLVNGKKYDFAFDVAGLVSGHSGNMTANWVILDLGNNIVSTIYSISTSQLSDVGVDTFVWNNFNSSFVSSLATGDYKLAMQWGGTGQKDMFFDRIYLGPSSTPPVVLDLNRDGHISYVETGVDINGDGLTKTAAWVGAADGTLVWDKYHDGKVHDSSQYAFAQYLNGATTDLEGLKAFDSNANGQLDSGDSIWTEMRVWQDLNGDGVTDAGEVNALAAWGLTSIQLTSDGIVSSPADGVREAGKSLATLADGSQMIVADVAFDVSTIDGQSGVVAHPFILDLNHDGQITYDKALIDVSGTGYKELIAWAGKGDGVLVWDKYQDGLVHDSSQYSFGSLKIFDTNGDSKLDSHDVLWSQLSVWQDANGDGVSEAGEVKTLAQLGIQSIGLTSDGAVTTPAEGVKELGKSAAVMEDGSAMTIVQAAVSHVTTDTLHPLSYLDQTYAVI